MVRRTLYGWFDTKDRVFRLSAYPSDAPVRPSLAFPTYDLVKAYLDQRRRTTVHWWPPLPRPWCDHAAS